MFRIDGSATYEVSLIYNRTNFNNDLFTSGYRLQFNQCSIHVSIKNMSHDVNFHCKIPTVNAIDSQS